MVREAYESYQLKISRINHDVFVEVNQTYKAIIESHDSKSRWKSITWSGDLLSKPHHHQP